MLPELVEALKSLGFTELESKIFAELIFLKEATASSLSKELKVHRRSVYDALERMVKKGVVGFFVKNGRKLYYPVPERVKELIHLEKSKLVKAEKICQQVFTSCVKTKETKAFMMSGREAIKQMFLNELRSDTDILIICTDIERVENFLGRVFLDKFTRERVQRGIKIRMLTSKQSLKYLKRYPLLDVKILPFEFISPAAFSTYNNILNIVLWSEEPLVIYIESDMISEAFRKFFEALWNAI